MLLYSYKSFSGKTGASLAYAKEKLSIRPAVSIAKNLFILEISVKCLRCLSEKSDFVIKYSIKWGGYISVNKNKWVSIFKISHCSKKC